MSNSPSAHNSPLKVSGPSPTSTEASLSSNILLGDRMRTLLNTGSGTLVSAKLVSSKDAFNILLKMNEASPSEILNSIMGTLFCYGGILMEESDPTILNNRPYLLSRLERQHTLTSLESSSTWNEASLDNIQALQALTTILPTEVVRKIQSQILKLLAKMGTSIADPKTLNPFYATFEEFSVIGDFVFIQTYPDPNLPPILLSDENYRESLIFDHPAHKRACLSPLLLESSPPPKSLDEYHELVSRSDRSLLRTLSIAIQYHLHDGLITSSTDFQLTVINLIRLLDVQKRWRENLLVTNGVYPETEEALFYVRLTNFGKEEEVVTLRECCIWFVFIFKTFTLVETYFDRFWKIFHEIDARLETLRKICSDFVDQEIERLSRLFKPGLLVADTLPRMMVMFWLVWLTKTLQSLPGGLSYLDFYLSPTRESPVPIRRRKQAVFWVVSSIAKLHLWKFWEIKDFEDFHESHRGMLSEFRKDDTVPGTPNFKLGTPLRVSEDVMNALDDLRQSLGPCPN